VTIEFINSSYHFSLYQNLVTVDKPTSNIDVNQLIEIIKYGYIKDIIAVLRGAVSKEKYNLIKKESIPCVTLSGVFTYRASTGLVNHRGLMQVDIDKVDDYQATFSKLCNDDYIYVCFRSPGGKGIKAIVKINPSQETHKSQFKALEIYFKKQFGIIIDSLCKDLARSMLLSFDPGIYCNPWSKVFEERYITKTYPKNTTRISSDVKEGKVGYADESIEIIETIINSLESTKIDITSSYENWIKVGFALCTTFGENGRIYYHRISRMYPKYTFEETDRNYIQLLTNNNGKTKLGTIIFLAREAGINISSRR
jgi:hypothetical protein